MKMEGGLGWRECLPCNYQHVNEEDSLMKPERAS